MIAFLILIFLGIWISSQMPNLSASQRFLTLGPATRTTSAPPRMAGFHRWSILLRFSLPQALTSSPSPHGMWRLPVTERPVVLPACKQGRSAL
jgi:hypothetical protein